MSYYECENSEHLAPLPSFQEHNYDSNSSDDSEVEITSTIDPNEYELIQLSAYLRVNSDSGDSDESDGDDKENNSTSNSLVPYPSSDDPDNDFCPSDIHNSKSPNTPELLPQSKPITPSTKLKRRQWSIREKLQAISTFEKHNNKYQTCKDHGCSPSQLRKWIFIKDELQAVEKRKKGQF